MRSVFSLLLLVCPGIGLAATVGDPVPHPDAGRFRLDVRLGSDAVQETDTRCTGSSGCDATWRRTELSGTLSVAVLRGLGVYGELGIGQDQIQAADYKGRSQAWGAGVKAAVPVTASVWLAADIRLDEGDGQSVLADEDPDPELTTYRLSTASVLGVWGDSARGGAVWLGAQSSWMWDHHVWPLGTEDSQISLDVPLAPRLPVSGVLGMSLSSDPVGLPWRTSTRLSVGLEGRAGQETGVSGWLGFAL